MQNKKKMLLVIALLLVALFGVTGYGAYSYYATQGSFETEDASSEDSENVIRITGTFKPTVDGVGGPSGSSSSGNSFLGNGGTLYLTCPETSSGHETITCTTSVTVKNEGTTGIYVDVEDASSDTNVEYGSVTASAEEPEFNWNETYISAGSSRQLNISVDVNVGSSNEVSDDTEEIVYGPVEGGEIKASVSFKIGVTQEH